MDEDDAQTLFAAATRNLDVASRLPARLDIPTWMDAELTRRDGRELHMHATVVQEGRTVATAAAVFIEVDLNHLAAPAARFGLT